MAEEWDWSALFEEDDNQTEQKVDRNDPKSLRQFAKKMADENKQLKTEFAKIAAASREKTIADKVAEQKLPAKVAKLIPKDIEPEKVGDWLKEYSDLWAPTSGQQEEQVVEDEQLVAEREALSRMSAATGSTVPATRPADQMAQVMDPNQTRDGLLKLIEQAGGGYGTG